MEEQINLANSYGIFRFAFYYYFSFEKKISDEPLDIILQNINLNINYFLILRNNTTLSNEIKNNISQIYQDIRKYIIDKRYIKFYNKSVIGVIKDDFDTKDLIIFREKFKKDNLGEIFLLSETNDYNYISEISIYDGFYYSPSYESLKKVSFHHNKTFAYFYTNLIYHNLLSPPLRNNNVFRMSVALTKYPIYINQTKTIIFGDYSPEKFYFLNKVIIDWTKKNYNKDNQYIFINNWNNMQKDSFLGYANFNSFSKALYELPFIFDNNNNFNITRLEKGVFVLVQAHVYYIDLIPEIINKTNNIPVPFDLYITTNSEYKKNHIENYLKENSKANKYEILITENVGRDVIPFLIQLKDNILNYNYVCHIHTKKHGLSEKLGKEWQHYLYENLLGNDIIIKQILSDFENKYDLGFIFPELFYEQIKYTFTYNKLNWYYMDIILDILFPNMWIRAGYFINYPVGNMFWARTDAIYQIFNEKIINSAPKERGQLDGTILHAIERIWLYIVKLNGFYYKTILYYI